MLATAGALPHGEGWTFEHKWDGFRALLWIDGSSVSLWSRTGTDLSASFPELVGQELSVPDGTLLDAELVVVGSDGRPVWKEVRRRTATRRPRAVAAAAERSPATLMVFDAPIIGREDRCRLPLAERRVRLADLELPARMQRVTSHGDGAALWHATAELELEGVVAKRADSRYRPGVRTRDWVKAKHLLTTTMRVAGVRRSAGRVRSVLVADADGDAVSWVDRWLPSIDGGSLGSGLPTGDGEVLGDGVTVHVRHLATPGLREPMIVGVEL